MPGRDGRAQCHERAAHDHRNRDPRLLPALPRGDGALAPVIAAAPGVQASLDLRARLAALYGAYDGARAEGEYERWPDFFTEACVYKITSRENSATGLPVGLIYAESRAMLTDRVSAI